MAITPSNDALTTVENARTYTNKTADNTPEMTAKLQLYINAYSAAIRRYTGRQFLPVQQAGTAKKFRYEGDGYLSLAPSEASAVTLVQLGTDQPTPRTLLAQSGTAESEYRLEPRNKTYEGTYLWLVLPEIGRYDRLITRPFTIREARGFEVTITGTWGAGVVPAEVELACLRAVANAMRNPEGFQSRTLGPMSFTEGSDPASETGVSLPKDARALLYPYRRTAYS